MSLEIEPLLSPISSDQPCGQDLSFSNEFHAIKIVKLRMIHYSIKAIGSLNPSKQTGISLNKNLSSSSRENRRIYAYWAGYLKRGQIYTDSKAPQKP